MDFLIKNQIATNPADARTPDLQVENELIVQFLNWILVKEKYL